MEMSRSGQ